MSRSVDAAMGEDRPDKAAVRRTWIADVQQIAREEDGPLYLTLCGRSGPEIAMLIDCGLIITTETGAIAAESAPLFVAVESSPNAVFELQDRYPGLTIVRKSISDMLGSASAVAWPRGRERSFSRARVVNLDFNGPLRGRSVSGQVVFEELELVSKLARLHAISPPRGWRLFITFNATLGWSKTIGEAVLSFLRENFDADDHFLAECAMFLGDHLMRSIREGAVEAVVEMAATSRQKLLMVFVPKKIAHLVHGQGWLVRTYRSLRYGGSGSRAPMISLALEFVWDVRSSATPREVYHEALSEILANTGAVRADGSVAYQSTSE